MNIFLRYRPEIIAFSGGAGVMIFEILGSRVVGPYIGTSLFVWTSLIAVILGALSLGNYYGGKIADTNASLRIISLMLLLAAGSIFGVIVAKDGVLLLLSSTIPDVRISSILIALMLFTPTSFLLGTLSPIITKIRLTSIKTGGAVIGRIGSIGTIGSIIGTLVAGFFLIPFFGVTQLLILLGVFFLLLSALCNLRNYILFQIIVLALLIIASLMQVSYEIESKKNGSYTYDTSYSHISISERLDYETQKNLRDLKIDNITHAGMFLSDNALVYEYTKYYDLFDVFSPETKNIVLFGGAAYSYPKHFLERYPDKKLTVVEIDPNITQIAKEHFRLDEKNKNLTIQHADARVFLNTTLEKYDAILGDAFGSYVSIPYQLTTREVAQKKYDLLTENGVVILNVIGSLQGEKARFLEAEYKTYSSVFPEVFIVPVYDMGNTHASQNIMLVAAKNPQTLNLKTQNQVLAGYLGKKMYMDVPKNTKILTDNFAPVDYMVAGMHN